MPKLLPLLAGSVLLTIFAGCEVVPYQPQPAPAPAPYPSVVYPSQPAPPPPDYTHEEIRRCRAENQRAHAEVWDIYERARQAGRIDPAEAQRFSAMDARLRSLRAQLGRDGISLQECYYIGSQIARDREEVLRMARFDPALGRCLADNRRAHQDVYALYDNARRAGRIAPREAQRFNAMEARLQGLRNDLGRQGLTFRECQAIGSAIAREREEVIRMSQYDPGIGRCMADNRRAHDDVYRVYNDGLASGRINPREAQRFQAIEGRLRGYVAELRRDGISMNDCLRIGQAIAQERAIVDGMSRNAR
jgi:hypothetical protein